MALRISHIHFHSFEVSAHILKTNMILCSVSRNVLNTSVRSTRPFTVHLNIMLINQLWYDKCGATWWKQWAQLWRFVVGWADIRAHQIRKKTFIWMHVWCLRCLKNGISQSSSVWPLLVNCMAMLFHWCHILYLLSQGFVNRWKWLNGKYKSNWLTIVSNLILLVGTVKYSDAFTVVRMP